METRGASAFCVTLYFHFVGEVKMKAGGSEKLNGEYILFEPRQWKYQGQFKPPLFLFRFLHALKWKSECLEKVDGYFVWSPVMKICRAVLVVRGKERRKGEFSQNLTLYVCRDDVGSHILLEKGNSLYPSVNWWLMSQVSSTSRYFEVLLVL